ncbi:hypothetical protein EYF80_007029 [Liparis tanakae]|uniref:Uncharacterized protein n=1 Tax=Liparis tanakae TaxID=230148 RepID=A0A4Z2IZ64_9TELE|nr:hypothetical protein EYF80_007029 [Liparis tanakae]
MLPFPPNIPFHPPALSPLVPPTVAGCLPAHHRSRACLLRNTTNTANISCLLCCNDETAANEPHLGGSACCRQAFISDGDDWGQPSSIASFEDLYISVEKGNRWQKELGGIIPSKSSYVFGNPLEGQALVHQACVALEVLIGRSISGLAMCASHNDNCIYYCYYYYYYYYYSQLLLQ